jgi:hypothetical protein
MAQRNNDKIDSISTEIAHIGHNIETNGSFQMSLIFQDNHNMVND